MSSTPENLPSPPAPVVRAPLSRWAYESLYFDGDTYYQAVIDAIGQAKKSVEFEVYIFDDDQIGEAIAESLAQAAARGVNTRLLVDGIGASAWVDRKGRALCQRGVHVRVYHPVRLSRLFSRALIDLGVRRRTASRSGSFLSHLNRRDHRKVVITDHEQAWVGSINVSQVHSKKAIGTLAWRDTAVAVRGQEIAELVKAYNHAWVRSHTMDGKREWTKSLPLQREPKRKKPRLFSTLVRLNFTLRLRRRGYRELSHKVGRAKRRIWITNAYLAPSKPVLKRLQKAAQRGVDVRILVPRKSDVFFMPWVAQSYYDPLLSSGVRIFEYLPRFLHAKSVMIDNWVMVGTSNLNRRSLLRDFEVDVVLKNPSSIETLEKQYAADLTESFEVKVAPKGLKARLGRLIIIFMKEWI